MSQSAASEALLNLEHTYQVSLFDRISNKLALNAIGHTLFINTWMDDHIQKDPWHDMGAWAKDGSRMTYKGADARFYEYNSSGPGAHNTESRRRLTEKQMRQFSSIVKLLDGWDPINENN